MDHRELQHVLLRHFPSASQPSLRTITFPGTDPWNEEYALKLEFSRKDRITAITGGSLLTPELADRLRRAVEDSLLVTADSKVFRTVLFAASPLNGAWRYRDRFQILPVPPGAPRLDCIMGEHPFVLEVRVPCSPDEGITNRRAANAAYEAQLLLCGLVSSMIRPLGRGYRFHWVSLPGEGQHAAYLQDYYPTDQIAQASVDFSPILISSAPLLPPLALFGPGPTAHEYELALPENLAVLLDVVDHLPNALRQDFLHACYWLKQAALAFPDSFSLSFMAVSAAIEALVEDRPSLACPTCEQKLFAGKTLTTLFAEFLDHHVPLDFMTSSGYGDIPSFKDRLKRLYATRSTLVHGEDLLGQDTIDAGFVPRQNQEHGDLRTLLRIMHYAFGTWLVEQDSSSRTAHREGTGPTDRSDSQAV